VFVGRREDIYPPTFQSFIEPLGSALPLEGAHRRGHFGGVATVVLKLLCLAAPQRAYFGEKDWQQLQVITALVRDFALDVEIVPCATVRASDGLALSSRNERLDALSRYQAPTIARALGAAAKAYAGGLQKREALEDVMRRELATARNVEVDYAVVVNAQTLLPWNGAPEVPRACIAARLGGVRLIDNAALDADPVGALAL
jgi:pantoate--beta-alanine ligase